jgi:hypothetical protein
MPSRNDVLVANLEELQQDLRDIWQSLTRDPAKEARKERGWTILAAVFTALGAVAARRIAAKAWGVLTGETAPMARPPQPARGGPSSRRPVPEADAESDSEPVPTST